MLKEREFIVMLTPTDRYRHRHLRLKVEVLSFVVPMFTEGYNEALTFAEFDVKSNWKAYKIAFGEGKPDEGTE